MNKREQIKGAYKSASWQKKVNRMTDEQVYAIWIRLKNQRKI